MMNWKKLKSEEVFNTKYFKLYIDQCENFDGKIVPKYFVVDFPDWVQVVAFDTSGQLICVEQYRYPGQGWFLEFPGGSTHANRQEDPQVAAARELKEETGHVSDEWISVGFHYPNPALQSNRCHVFIARNCREVSSLELDPFECLRVRKMPLARFEEELRKSPFRHSLMLATLELARPSI